MNIERNGYVVNNLSNIIIARAERETAYGFNSELSLVQQMSLYNSNIIIPVFRLYLLDDYENILKDISNDFLKGSLSCTYQSGKRRTLNITLLNREGLYSPHGSNSLIYLGCRFKLETGIFYNKTIYWFPQGIFLLQDPQQSSNDSEQTVSFNLHDKFSLFDGTIGGNSTLKTIVPQGVPMKQAFVNIITSDRGDGVPYDIKPIIFNSEYILQETYKTIKQDFNANIGDVLIDCANTISSDIYYNKDGNMTVESNVNKFLAANFPIALRIKDGDKIVRNKNLTYNWSKLRNKIVVKGAITNGYQFTGTAENTNRSSPYNIYTKYGIRPEVITDSKLYSDKLCLEKAMYSLVEKQRGVKSLNLSLGYIPSIDVNQSVLCNFDELNLQDENFVIDSFSMNISSDSTVSVSLTNIGEVIFNG